MPRIVLASFAIFLAMLGLLFGVGLFAISRSSLPSDYVLPAALVFAVLVVTLQFALGPTLIEWVTAIRWTTPVELGPDFAAWMGKVCGTYQIPVPRLGIIEDQAPNAFTYGHGPWNARVVVSRGLITALTPEELKAVVGHELGHVRNRDFVFMTLVQAIVLCTYVIFRMSRRTVRRESAIVIPLSFLVYQISYYLSLLISRMREYMADYASAQIMQDANCLASALVKISYGLADTSGTAFKASFPSGPGPASPLRPLAPSRQAATPPPASASVYDYNAPQPDINKLAARGGDVPADVMARVQAMQADHHQQEMAPLNALLGNPTGRGAARVKKHEPIKLGSNMIGAFGVCGFAGALSAVGWMAPGGGIDTANFSKAARWELYNPWAKIAEMLSTHPLTARRIKALMKLNSRFGATDQFDLNKVQPGRYGRFLVDLLILTGPYLFAVAAYFGVTSPAVHQSPIVGAGAAVVALALGFMVGHFAMYRQDFVRSKVLVLLGELNVSHVNPKPVVVEGVFTGYVDAGRMWSHHFVLQDDTGFIATQYHQIFGAEYLLGFFKNGRALGRPVRVEGWYRRFGSPILEISNWEYLDTREKHRSWRPVLRFLSFVLLLLLGFGLLALGVK
jgi:Zn-dependent protease with chaperone function